MDLIQKMLSEHGGELVSKLTSETGLGAQQAQEFLPAAGNQLAGVLGGGGLDLGALLGGGGDLGALIAKFDLGALAGAANTDEATARNGLETLLPRLLSLLGEGGGAAGLLQSLGGGKEGLLGAAGKLAGGFFKR